VHSVSARLVSLDEIQIIARRSYPKALVLFAGRSALLPPPSGLSEILRRSNSREPGATGGITLIKTAESFTPPRFTTKNTVKRNGNQVQHFATVQATEATDVVHESFYPGPGDYLRPGMNFRDGNRTYLQYWRVSRQMSELIRRGEEEHLGDARRAFELTYKLIADAINSLAGQTFGPAASSSAADALAEAALARILPKELSTDPANWPRVLDRLLSLSKKRDTQGWHSVANAPSITEGNRILHPLMTTPGTKIGKVASSQLVNY
jgi:hypothetical protein